MATGDLHKLGTLLSAGANRIYPTRPWNSMSTPDGATEPGNLLRHIPGITLGVGDTYDVSDLYKLRWIEVNLDNKKILISDRSLYSQTSWDELSSQGLVFGKEITIDGNPYILRIMTSDEWDRIIGDTAKLVGLPRALDTKKFYGNYNIFWNYLGIYSWVQDSAGTSNRVIKGNWNNNNTESATPNTRYPDFGWRPVLEVVASAPSLSPKINGVWRDYESGYTKINGAWREIEEIHTKINGIWRKSE